MCKNNYTVFFKMLVLLLAITLQSDKVMAQVFVRDNGQKQFKHTVPAGNYSGIAPLGGTFYALADDKAPWDGFRIVEIMLDSISGAIQTVQDIKQVATANANRDAEGIVYLPHTKKLMVVGEADNRVVEYDLDGNITARELELPSGVGNGSYESLAYDTCRQILWTCTEEPFANDVPLSYSNSENAFPGALLRLQAYDRFLKFIGQWPYVTDAPTADKSVARNYASGVSELLVCGDSTLLVLERECFVPHSKIGAWVKNKIYKVKLSQMYREDHSVVQEISSLDAPVEKELLYSWKTSLTLLKRSFANYEGMCLGPKLVDGSQVLLLVSDSQNQAHGVLRDWFRSIIIR